MNVRATGTKSGDDVWRVIRHARLALGWSQRELGRRSGVPQTAISRLEREGSASLTFGQLRRMTDALGVAVRFTFEAPFLQDRVRQRDRVHARCIAFVGRRMQASGWELATEVEIYGRGSPGWIDVLAFHPRTRTLLVIEIKTEIHDFGQIQRTLAWYESNARRTARSLGWAPDRVCGALVVLATAAVDRRLRDNRDLLVLAFPGRIDALRAFVADPGQVPEWRRTVAVVDPFSRASRWLRAPILDARRAPSPHADYAEVARRLEANSAVHRRAAVRAISRG